MLYCQIHLTTRCQNACKHCYFNEIYKCTTDFPYTDLISFMNGIKKKAAFLNVPVRIDFTGGDPFLYPQISQVVEYCKDSGIQYGFKCNPEEILENDTIINDFLLDSSGVSLSLDGLQDVHDSYRRGGSFTRTIQAASKIKENGIKLKISTTVSKQNLNNLIPLIEFLVDEKFIIDDYTWTRYWSLNNRENIIQADVLFDVFNEMTTYMESLFNSLDFYYKSVDGRLVPRIMFGFKEHQWYPYFIKRGILNGNIVKIINESDNCINCTATKHFYIVDPDGTVFKCRKLPETIINTEDIGTIAGCDYSKGAFLECKKCYYYNGCGGCSAISKSITGSILKREPHCPYYKK